VTLDELGPQLAARQCDLLARCDHPASFDADSCLAGLTASSEDALFARARKSVEAGRIHYDAHEASACLAKVARLTCDEAKTDEPEACQRVFVGTLEDGARCTLNDECKSGDCDNGGEGCPGTCMHTVPEGETCSAETRCAGHAACLGGVCTRERNA